MKNLCLWTIISLYGTGLIFDGTIRHDYYTSFSYLFPTNTTFTQEIADISRLAVGLLMTLSIFNVFGGLLFKILPMFGFVVFSVVSNQEFILNPSMNNKHTLCSILTHLVLVFLCMDSVINTIIEGETKVDKQKTRQIIENTKKEQNKKEEPIVNTQQKKGSKVEGKKVQKEEQFVNEPSQKQSKSETSKKQNQEAKAETKESKKTEKPKNA